LTEKDLLAYSQELDRRVESLKKLLAVSKLEEVENRIRQLQRDLAIKQALIRILVGAEKMDAATYIRGNVENCVMSFPSMKDYFILRTGIGKNFAFMERYENPTEFIVKLERAGFKKEE